MRSGTFWGMAGKRDRVGALEGREALGNISGGAVSISRRGVVFGGREVKRDGGLWTRPEGLNQQRIKLRQPKTFVCDFDMSV